MPTDHRAALARIRRVDQLIPYLRDEMGWPIETDDFEELTFEYTPDELGIDTKNTAKIQQIKRLRPLAANQPWGIFFVKFEPKKLPVVALRRILSQVALKKRASANSAERAAWATDDLLFVSNYGEGDERKISFAHFSPADGKHDLPILRVLGWDDRDTALHLDGVATELTTKLSWPQDESNQDEWRARWRSAFTLRPDEAIKTSKSLAMELARLARRIRARIETALSIETERGPLTKLMKAFQEALVHDLDAGGFADMYAQTIAHGLLSARITDPKANTADGFAVQLPVTNPFLKELMGTFLKVGGRRGKAGGPGIDFDELGVSEVVELLDDANMEAVVRDFGDRNPQEDPVIHFYELFLKEYDAKKRMQRGVFYTPRPVVSYIVRSVHELLQTEFGLADGLADTATWGEMAARFPPLPPGEGRGEGTPGLTIPEGVKLTDRFVTILDIATGTGTFLVEVIEVIHCTLVEKWKRAGHSESEILDLWNDYVPKHLLPRLYGYELLMAPYAIAHLRIGLKLRETGYRFESDERVRIYLTNALEPASLLADAKAAGLFEALGHEAQAVNEVKRKQRFTVVMGNPPYSNFGQLNRIPIILTLLGDYKRGLDEKKLNLDDDFIKFVRFAQHLVTSNHVGLIGLITNATYLDGVTHRQMRRSLLEDLPHMWLLNLHGNTQRKETPPPGQTNENVFDIMQGVAISLLVRPPSGTAPRIRYTDSWGTRAQKYLMLAEAQLEAGGWTGLMPRPPAYFLVPKDLSSGKEYEAAFTSARDMFPLHSLGFETSRDNFAVGFDSTELEHRIQDLRSQISSQAIRARYGLDDRRDWDLTTARADLRSMASWRKWIVRCAYRPFDTRWVYFDRSVTTWPRHEVLDNLLQPNIALVCVRNSREESVSNFWVVSHVADKAVISSRDNATVFPLWRLDGRWLLGVAPGASRAENMPSAVTPRFSALAAQSVQPEDIVSYCYAVFHSGTYRIRYREFLKIDFPRIPLPGSPELFQALARLGGELVGLHLMESPKLDRFIATYTGPKNPEVGRVGWSDGTVWLDAAATKKGQPATPGSVGFRGVPEDVWNFHIGAYQVCEKWLKDRKGRTLSQEDIAHYQKIVVALNETIRLMEEIDEVIEKHGGWPAAFQTGEAKAATATVIPFRPRIVEPKPEERYVTCVPLVPLKAAAGAFSDPQHVEADDFEWVQIDSIHRLRPGMFLAQVVGKSMEPAIPDGAYCLFAAPVTGTREGKTVLVQLRDQVDPETGERYTVKRYESEKTPTGDSWRHTTITLKPLNPDFEPIVLTAAGEGQLQVIAELVEVLQ